MAVTLKSRFPQITTSLPLRVGAAIREGVEAIADDARAAAPDRHPYGEGLPESIEARSGEFRYGSRSAFGMNLASDLGFAVPTRQPGRRSDVVGDIGYGVWAAWYARYLEFGTVRASPRPFLIPALESHKPRIEAAVTAVLRSL